jgi:hypothetical protein
MDDLLVIVSIWLYEAKQSIGIVQCDAQYRFHAIN